MNKELIYNNKNAWAQEKGAMKRKMFRTAKIKSAVTQKNYVVLYGTKRMV